jgi:serine/threonine-protein kinase
VNVDTEQLASVLPGYAIGEVVGRGGFGTVVAATHLRLGRRVAVKQLPQALADDDVVRRRFVTEAKVLSTLDHPHLVPVYDYVEQDGLCLLVLGLLDSTLWERHEASALTAGEACAAGVAACAALDYAHLHGVLHRDVKPTNLMFSHEGVLKVVDFGIAKVVGGDASVATAAGQVLGSPAYMAPEQVTGSPPGPATDVYALATVLYEVFSGRLPFETGGEMLALLGARVRAEPIPLGEVADVASPLAAAVMAGLARQPEDRPPGAEAFGIRLAEAATAGLGAGWLTEAGTPVYATGALLQSLDGARRDHAPPASGVLLPGPTGQTGGGSAGPVPSSRLAELLPVHELVERSIPDPPAEPTPAPVLSPVAPVPVARVPVAPPEAVLDLHEPGRPARSVTVRLPATFGRRNADVVLADPEVSRRHLQLSPGGPTAAIVEDLGSTNGTVADGVTLVGPTSVTAGAVIEAGECQVVVRELRGGSAPAAAPAASPASPASPGIASARVLEVGGLRLLVADPTIPAALAASLEDEATVAWSGLDRLGLAAVLAEAGPVTVSVERTAVGEGTQIGADGSVTWLVPVDLPPDPLLPTLALLAGARTSAGRVLDVVALGLGLGAAGLPDPAPGLRQVPLAASVPEATGDLRVAMARSFAGYLVARSGEPAVVALLRSVPPPEFHERARDHLGAALPALDAEWRRVLETVPPGGPLAGPVLAPLVPPGVTAGDALAEALVVLGASVQVAADVTAAARASRLTAGSRTAEGRWLVSVSSGTGALVVVDGPLAATPVVAVGPGSVFGAASVAGVPHGLALQADTDLDLLLVDEADLAPLGLPLDTAPGGSTDLPAGGSRLSCRSLLLAGPLG